MIYRFLLICSFFILQSCASNNSIKDEFTSQINRLNFQTYLLDTLINKQAVDYLKFDSLINWDSFCWGLTLAQSQSETAKDALRKQLKCYPNIDKQKLRSIMEAVYCCFPSEFANEMALIFQSETNNKLFAMAAAYMYRTKADSILFSMRLDSLLTQRFNESDTLIQGLKYFISDTIVPLPPLVDLFHHQQTHKRKIIYSFQNKNRDLPGFAILQYEDGSFARYGDSSLVRFPQLARSASNLPSFLTNGNTPQGVFSIADQAISDNKFIGTTPAFICHLPFEVGSDIFFHQEDAKVIEPTMSMGLYLQLFPLLWQHYAPILEAYRAGKIGRSEIHIHGSTIDPSYYVQKTYYPFTPSMGCLCGKEIWTDGVLVESSQLQLIHYFNKTPAKIGFVIVLDHYIPELEKWIKGI